MEINVTPEDVDALVKNALLKASIGKAVSAAVNKMFTAYNNPIDEHLRQFVGEVARDLIREKFSQQIKEAVACHVEAKVTQELVLGVVDRSINKMVRAAEEGF